MNEQEEKRLVELLTSKFNLKELKEVITLLDKDQKQYHKEQLNMRKVIPQLLCLTSFKCHSVEQGVKYKMVYEDDFEYILINDRGKTCKMYKMHFKKVSAQ